MLYRVQYITRMLSLFELLLLAAAVRLCGTDRFYFFLCGAYLGFSESLLPHVFLLKCVLSIAIVIAQRILRDFTLYRKQNTKLTYISYIYLFIHTQ